MSLATQLKRSIRAGRRAIKRSLPFQGFDALARRRDPAVRYLPATGAP